jgi:transposase
MSQRQTGVSRTKQLSCAQDPPVRNKGGRPRTRPHHIKIAGPAPGRQDPPAQPTRYLGLDVHAETIAVAIADALGEPYSYGAIPSTPEAVRKLVGKLGAEHTLVACYEAGPCGYWLWRLFTAMGIPCDVVAPNLIPQKPTDRVKTDTRDALKLARLLRSGDLTAVWVPDEAHEALRDLVRAREDAMSDRTRARHRLTKFLLRHGVRRPPGINAWTSRHRKWLVEQVIRMPLFQPAVRALTLHEYLHEIDRLTERLARYDAAIARTVREDLSPERQAVVRGLQALRGVGLLTAATVVSELGQLSRFRRPSQLMSYAGIVPRERSSGGTVRRSGITKTGNAHLRRILVEAAWSYRYPPKLTRDVRLRHAGQPERIKAIAWAAQLRLTDRYTALLRHRKPLPQVIAAVARELLGFMWAIGVEAERPYLAGATTSEAAA